MPNYKASGGKLVLLDKHITTGDETTYTFTPVATLTPAVYRSIIYIINGKNTATNEIRLQFNGITASTYKYTSALNDSGADTDVFESAGTYIRLLTAALLDSSRSFYIKVQLHLHQQDLAFFESHAHAGGEGHEQTSGYCATALSGGITEIKYTLSTSSMVDGTEISTYGLKAL